MAKLTFIGHGSLMLVTNEGKTIYIDPFFKGDYKNKCDLVLITHYHDDHTNESLLTKNENCTTITPKEAIIDGEYKVFNICDMTITPVQAYNENHSVKDCVGYVICVDGVTVYIAGDTSKTDDMVNKLASMNIDYATLPIDGSYNMNPQEATECANIIKAKKVIPIHNDPNVISTLEYSDKGISDFTFEGKVILKYGETLELIKN